MVKTLFVTLWLLSHPVHVSLMSIDYVPDNDAFNVFLKVFYDDFLLDYGLEGSNQQPFDFSADQTYMKDRLLSYINGKIILKVNGRNLAGRIEDVNLTDGELKMNLIFSSQGRVRTVTIRSLIMTDLYSDQANMVILKVNGFEEGFRLTPEKTEETFKMK